MNGDRDGHCVEDIGSIDGDCDGPCEDIGGMDGNCDGHCKVWMEIVMAIVVKM